MTLFWLWLAVVNQRYQMKKNGMRIILVFNTLFKNTNFQQKLLDFPVFSYIRKFIFLIMVLKTKVWIRKPFCSILSVAAFQSLIKNSLFIWPHLKTNYFIIITIIKKYIGCLIKKSVTFQGQPVGITGAFLKFTQVDYYNFFLYSYLVQTYDPRTHCWAPGTILLL